LQATSESKTLNFSENYNQKYNENLSYDIRGNILSLQRNTANGAGMTNIDNLAHTYNNGMTERFLRSKKCSSQMNIVKKPSKALLGIVKSKFTMCNKNYSRDPYKKITSAKYYYHNQPKDITVNGGGTLRFTYDAAGMKLRKESYNLAGTSVTKQDYVGKIEYVNGVVEAVYHPEGRAVYNPNDGSWRYEYNVTDHLGNVRAVISDHNNNGILDITTNSATSEIINQNDYYPLAWS
jgi:hypothetical protein